MSALHSLRLQLITFIGSIFEEGVVNDNFLSLHANKERKDSVIRAITLYYRATRQLFIALTELIEQPGRVDFNQVNELAMDFYAKSCDIGAENMRCACAELIRASLWNDKNSCSAALYWAKNRFSYLMMKLEVVVQMERNIIYIEDHL